jgi:hypothetical protein
MSHINFFMRLRAPPNCQLGLEGASLYENACKSSSLTDKNLMPMSQIKRLPPDSTIFKTSSALAISERLAILNLIL